MTDYTALIAELHTWADSFERHSSCTPGCPEGDHDHGVVVYRRAADAIEALVAENARLKRTPKYPPEIRSA